MKRMYAAQITLVLTLLALPVSATDWPHWRGPNHNGTTDETGLPSTIDPANDVKWAADMPGSSSSTPIISNGRVFVSSNDGEEKRFFGICLDEASGEILWNRQLAETDEKPRRNSMSSCSPVTDGETVYFLYGTGDLVALDFDGNEKWRVSLVERYGPIHQQFGYSSSPLLFDGKLYIQIYRGQWEPGLGMPDFTDKDQRLICMDPATGDEIWVTKRPSAGNGEAFDAYTSPVPYEWTGVKAIVTQGGDAVSAHSADEGKELWRQEHNPRRIHNWRLIPSPLVMDELVFGSQPRGGQGFAIKPDGTRYFALEDSYWVYDRRTTDVPCAAYYDGLLYIVIGVKGSLLCLDPKTGEELWSGDLDPSARIWASPTIADGKIYCLDENGQVTVGKLDKDFEVLSQADFGGGICKSTIAIANGNLFVRTSEKLYCVGK